VDGDFIILHFSHSGDSGTNKAKGKFISQDMINYTEYSGLENSLVSMTINSHYIYSLSAVSGFCITILKIRQDLPREERVLRNFPDVLRE
jgi:hypothetical protein